MATPRSSAPRSSGVEEGQDQKAEQKHAQPECEQVHAVQSAHTGLANTKRWVFLLGSAVSYVWLLYGDLGLP